MLCQPLLLGKEELVLGATHHLRPKGEPFRRLEVSPLPHQILLFEAEAVFDAVPPCVKSRNIDKVRAVLSRENEPAYPGLTFGVGSAVTRYAHDRQGKLARFFEVEVVPAVYRDAFTVLVLSAPLLIGRSLCGHVLTAEPFDS